MPLPVYNPPYPHPGDDYQFAYQVASMASSEMGSPEDTPYCSPRQGSTELVNPYPQQQPQERIHTTSGVSSDHPPPSRCPLGTLDSIVLTAFASADGHKIELLSVPFANARRSMPRT
jgi:hypothetical protein